MQNNMRTFNIDGVESFSVLLPRPTLTRRSTGRRFRWANLIDRGMVAERQIGLEVSPSRLCVELMQEKKSDERQKWKSNGTEKLSEDHLIKARTCLLDIKPLAPPPSSHLFFSMAACCWHLGLFTHLFHSTTYENKTNYRRVLPNLLILRFHSHANGVSRESKSAGGVELSLWAKFRLCFFLDSRLASAFGQQTLSHFVILSTRVFTLLWSPGTIVSNAKLLVITKIFSLFFF